MWAGKRKVREEGVQVAFLQGARGRGVAGECIE